MFSGKGLAEELDLSEKNLGLRDAKKGRITGWGTKRKTVTVTAVDQCAEPINSGSCLTVDFLSFSNPGWSYKR